MRPVSPRHAFGGAMPLGCYGLKTNPLVVFDRKDFATDGVGDFVVVGGTGPDSAQHFDGASWRSLVLPAHGVLEGVWGAHARDVYIVATDVLLHCRIQ